MPFAATFKHHPKARKLVWPSALTFPLVLFVIVTCFYWKLVFTYQYDWVWGPDLAQQVLPWFDEEARQVQHGQIPPLWDPHSWMGQPFPGQAQPGATYPLNWLLWLMPRQHGHINMIALHWYYVVIHFMAALFCYLLCRDLGRSRGASLIAGLAFTLGGYVGWTDWPQMLNGGVWAPLVFLFLLRAVRGVHPWASAWLCGASLGMSWLSGHHQAPIFLTLASGGVWLYYALKDGRIDWRVVRLAGVAMAIGPIVGALQILPAQEYGRLAWRWAGARDHLAWDDVIPYYVHTQHALHPIHLLGFLFPGFDENAGNFIGTVALSLGLLGIALCWREHIVKLFAAVAVGGVVYSLGGHSIFQGFLYAVVPFVEKARVPAMALLLFHIGLVVVAAFGVDAIRSSADSQALDSPWARRVNLGIAGFAIFLGATIFAILIARRFNWDMDNRIVVTCLIAFLLTALVYGWRKGNLTRPQAVTLLALLLLFELGNESSFMLADRNDDGRRNFIDKSWGNSDVADFLHAQPGPFRVETETGDIVRNWGDYYNLDFVGAQAGVTRNTFELETNNPRTKRLLGVKYTLARTPTDREQVEVFRGASGVAVYENPATFPRAWAVHYMIPIRSNDEGREYIAAHGIELLWQALYKGGNPPKVPPCEGGKDNINVAKYAPARVSIRAEVTCDVMVVLSDTYYPGWNATVDGKPAEIYEVDLALRGVLVPKGAHDIVFQYRPRSVYLGAGLTFAGLLGAAVITTFSRKKKHRRAG